jgi:tetratricopeptide (TPR) repeat protein
MIQQAVGELIRQLRRQRSLTQTELGGIRFSKSYVSAVERDKITPSLEALHFFAEQLGQPSDYFVKLKQDTEERKQHFAVLQTSQRDYLGVQEEFLHLLDVLLEGTEQHVSPLAHDLPTFSPEMIATLPPQRQTHYSFLRGLIAQDKQDFPTAVHAFEQALVLAPANHQPAILDELGNCYYLAHIYQTALGYHARALRALEELPNNVASALRLRVELHCGNDYRALSAYEQARTHYERARQHLNSTHDMRTAGQLYLGLGYCTYACAYEKTLTTSPLPPQEIESEFQRAISYLLQSRTLYQISGDRMGESTVRLLQAMVLLDLCTIRRQTDQELIRKAAPPSPINSVTLLEEVQEQCHQVLILWQDAFDTGELPTELETIIFTSLAYLIRAYTQRAAFARIGGYTDTANRERSLATHLCQQVLDTFSAHDSPWALVHDVIHIPMSSLIYQSPSLPRLPDLRTQREIHSTIIQVELYFAAGEVAEELGRAATTHEYGINCYRQADQCYRVALTMVRSIQPDEEHDPGSLLRYYQRGMCLLEERIQTSSESTEEHIRTLLNILKIGLSQSQHTTVQ